MGPIGSAVAQNSRTLLRSSSLHRPSDPPFRVVWVVICSVEGPVSPSVI